MINTPFLSKTRLRQTLNKMKHYRNRMSQQIHSPFSDPHSVSWWLVDKDQKGRLAFPSPLTNRIPYGNAKIRCYVVVTILCCLLLGVRAWFAAAHFIFVTAIALVLLCTCKLLDQRKAQDKLRTAQASEVGIPSHYELLQPLEKTFTARPYKSSPFSNFRGICGMFFCIWLMATPTSAQEVWTSRTSAADNFWNSVTYGNSIFVAVAYSGIGNRVMTSPNGMTWTSRTSAADNQWLSVTYGNNLFVAVSNTGTGNRVMTSPNGMTWTSRTSAADNHWMSVTFGNNLFVAVSQSGTGNRVMTSPDGMTWTSRPSAADNNWYSVTYGNNLFVAVSNTGTGNRVMTSAPGCAVGYINHPTCTQCTNATHCNGKASSVTSNSGKTACECTCVSGVQGATCSECAVGYINYPTCTQCTVATHCNDKATSVTSNAAKTACECTCTALFMGSACEQCAVGRITYPTCTQCTSATHCNDKASAVTSNSNKTACVCTCMTHRFQGASCGQCGDGHFNYPNCTAIIPFQDGLGYTGNLTSHGPITEIIGWKMYKGWPSGFIKGTEAFIGGICDGTNVWMIPYNADRVVRVRTSDGTMQGYKSWPSGFIKSANTFVGGIYDGTYVWMIPHDADRVLRVRTSDGSMQGYNSWPSNFTKAQNAFFGGAFDGAYVWMIPYNADRMVRVLVSNGTMQGFNSWPSGFTNVTHAFCGGVFGGSHLWMIPFNADRVVRVQTFDGTMQGFNFWPSGFTKGTGAFIGGIYDGTYVWMIPYNADRVVRVHTFDETMQEYNGWPTGAPWPSFAKGASAFRGGLFDGASVWLTPSDAPHVVRVRTSDGTMQGYNAWPSGFTKRSNAFSGGVFDGNSVWMIPHDASHVFQLRMTPGDVPGSCGGISTDNAMCDKWIHLHLAINQLSSSRGGVQALGVITAFLMKSCGGRLRLANEAITITRVDPEEGLGLGGVMSLNTDADGKAVFNSLVVTRPKAGTYSIFFSLPCYNGKLLDAMEVTVLSHGHIMLWANTPPNTIHASGYPPISYTLRLIDANGHTVTSDSTTTVTMFAAATDDNKGQQDMLTLTEKSVVAVRGLATFHDLQIQQLSVGRTIVVWAQTCVTPTPQSSSTNCLHSEKLKLKVLDCSPQWEILSAVPLSSTTTTLGRLRNVTVKGIIPYSARKNIACRLGEEVTKGVWLDVCHIYCQLPLQVPKRSAMLEVSVNRGAGFSSVGRMAGEASSVKVVQLPKWKVIETTNIVNISALFYIIDTDETALLDTYPSLHGRNRHLIRSFVNCHPVTPNLAFVNPALFTRIPFLGGVARLNVTLTPNPDPGEYTLRCNATIFRFESASGWVRSSFNGPVSIKVTGCAQNPIVESISGCTTSSRGHAFGCRTDGGHVMTLVGRFFGRKGAMITLERNPKTKKEFLFEDDKAPQCSTVHDSASPTTRLFTNCSGTGSNNTLYITLPSGRVATSPSTGIRVSFNPKPFITSIEGCAEDFSPSTYGCFLNGTNMLQIKGHNFGRTGAAVRFYFQVPLNARTFVPCSSVKHADSTGQLLNCTGFASAGQNLMVAVRNQWGEETLSEDVTLSFIDKVIVACPGVSGYCNNRGVCDTDKGTCTCFNDATNGFWLGSDCAKCQPGRWGPDCRGTCPGGTATPCMSPLGTCSDGITGNGRCTCLNGYGGLACDQECPGGASSPCSGHGVCVQGTSNPTCACYASSDMGYWSGATCRICAVGYVSSGCTQLCPGGNTSICSGHGTCAASATFATCTCAIGFCSSDCSLSGSNCGTCDPGKFGAGCNKNCPGFPNTCNGHGTCSEGIQGTGLCTCFSGYASIDCSVTCAGGASTPCSNRGQCELTSGSCKCYPGYAGASCNIECPGKSVEKTCQGHGVCFDGANGNGTCACYRGFWGAICQNTCPGGSAAPCSLHGTCDSLQGLCTCFSTQLLGYWSGSACDVCQSDWWGPQCNGTCVKTNGLQCAGHGRCTHTLNCVCAASSLLGYWASPNCSTCLPGYWGLNCTSPCPGSACAPCSFHGVCHDGVTGNGTCTCFNNPERGFWSTFKCGQCSEGYFGKFCQERCPTSNDKICNGRGTCSQGVQGSGLCTCDMNPGRGMWGGSSCDTCLTGYYGASCTMSCPGTPACSQQGVCFDGLAGNGTCKCNPNYYGSDCSRSCPVSQMGMICSGNGNCVDDSNRTQCVCYDDDANGYFTGSLCNQCMPGKYGPFCILSCPMGGVNNSLVCSGHGKCSEGTAGLGNCTCSYGWAGKKCNIPCQGGALNPCSGHGLCSRVSGECLCQRSPSTGYWSSRNCSQCEPMYQSSRCMVRCPSSDPAGRIPCSGHGLCFEGLCVSCTLGYCGEMCEKSGFDCAASCPDGYYGSSCEFLCPGGGKCSQRGYCSQGKEGSGKCVCMYGSWGLACDKICAGGFAIPCSGHGQCSLNDGTCKCRFGWAKFDCSTPCNGGPANPCNGRGHCDINSGRCTCEKGFVGAACEKLCPGGALNICSGHGTCGDMDGVCTCTKSAKEGYWNGTRCDGCAKGYQGPSCESRCLFGKTVGKVCICNKGFSGTSCDQPCPGTNSKGVGQRCNGHGNCTYGHTMARGSCKCMMDYYGSDCSIFCSQKVCAAAPFYLKNSQCNGNGACECANSKSRGYFKDPSTQCTVCKELFWGIKCDQDCPCSRRGGCHQLTGVCKCFKDSEKGFFAGKSCDRCADGYIGVDCKSQNVAITRVSSKGAPTKVEDRESSFLLVDVENDLVYAGGKPMVVMNFTTRAKITDIVFPGSIISGSIQAKSGQIKLELSKLTDHPGATEGSRRILMIARNLDSKGHVAILRRGNVFTVKTKVLPPKSSSGPKGIGRRLQAVPIYTQTITVETITVNAPIINNMILDDSYSVLSSGAVSRVNGLNQVEDNIFSDYFSQVSCAAMTNSLLIDPTRLLIGGTKSSTWQMISVEMPSIVNGRVEELSIFVNIPECANQFCQNVGKIITDGTYVIFAIQTKTGASLARFRYTQLGNPNVQVEYSVVRDSVPLQNVVNITAIALDPLSHSGFVAMNADGEATTLYKFDMVTLSVYGNVRFQRSGPIYEIVTSLSRDDVNRQLLASIPLDFQLQIVPLNLYAVTRVFPPIADTAGGTMITIEGEGFMDDNPQCDFNGTLVPAELVSSRELRCLAPTGGDERCDGNPLEVSLGKSRYSKNNIPLRRISSPRIIRVYTQDFMGTDEIDSYGELQGGRMIVIEGFGIENTTFLGCRIKSSVGIDDAQYAAYADSEFAYFDGKQGQLYNQAQFVSSSRMICMQPKFPNPTKVPAYLEVTLDGTAYTRSNSLYEVVGPAVSIKAFLNTTVRRYIAYRDFELKSDSKVEVPEVLIGVIDAEGHRLRKLDSKSQRSISVRLLSYNPVHFFLSKDEVARKFILPGATGVCDAAAPVIPMPILYNNERVRTTVDGMASFRGTFMHRPPSGIYTLRYTATLTGWTHDLNFTILTGTPSELRICQEPGHFIDNNVPTLAVQPVLYMVDSSKNQIPSAHLQGYSVYAFWTYERTTSLVLSDHSDGRKTHGTPKHIIRTSFNKTQAAGLKDNFYTFMRLEMFGLHGHSYNISFYAAETSTDSNGTITRISHIPVIHSRSLKVKGCPNNIPFQNSTSPPPMYFAKKDTSECYFCPDNGVCDGSSDVFIRSDNWWRASEDSLQFYSCAPPYGGDSCLAPNGTCVEGYQGPRCSVCAEGYGKSGSYCIKCIEPGLLTTLFALAIFVGLVFCIVMMWLTLNASRTDLTGTVLKLFISHLQVSSRINLLGRPLPDPMVLFFDLQRKMSDVARLDFATVDCAPLYLSYYDKFFFLVSMPFCLIGIFGVFFVLVKAWNIMRCQTTRNNAQQHRGVDSEEGGAVRPEEEEDKATLPPSVTNTTQKRLAGYFAATIVIVLFLIFPNVLQETMDLLTCDNIVKGDGDTYEVISYFIQNRNIRCTDPQHQAVSMFALVYTIIYAIGAPTIALGLIAYYWKMNKWRETRKVFSFVLAGYAKETWWWEVVVLARKVAIVSCVVFITDKSLQVYVAMWSIMIALTMHCYFHPFNSKDFPMLHYLEGLSLSIISITLNLRMLFQFPEFQEVYGHNKQPGYGYAVLSNTLLILNILMMLLFLYYLLVVTIRRIRKSFLDPHSEEARRIRQEEEENDPEADDSEVLGLRAAIQYAITLHQQQQPPSAVVAIVQKETEDDSDEAAAAKAEEKEKQQQQQVEQDLKEEVEMLWGLLDVYGMENASLDREHQDLLHRMEDVQAKIRQEELKVEIIADAIADQRITIYS